MSRRPEWSAKITKLVADQVRHYRQVRGWSIQQLSNELAARGLRMDRPVLSNLENGRRGTLSLDEWLVLADVLQAPALLLLFPLGRLDTMEVLPGREMTPWQALSWAERLADEAELPTDTVHLFREHERAIRLWRKAGRQVEAGERLLAGGQPEPGVEPPEDPDEIKRLIARWEPEREHYAAEVRRLRARIRDAELDPPRLPLGLRYLDEEPS